MTTNHDDTLSEQRRTLLFMADTFRAAASVPGELTHSEDDMDLASIFEQGIEESAPNADELMRLWGISLLYSQIAKRLYLASVESSLGADRIDSRDSDLPWLGR